MNPLLRKTLLFLLNLTLYVPTFPIALPLYFLVRHRARSLQWYSNQNQTIVMNMRRQRELWRWLTLRWHSLPPPRERSEQPPLWERDIADIPRPADLQAKVNVMDGWRGA